MQGCLEGIVIIFEGKRARSRVLRAGLVQSRERSPGSVANMDDMDYVAMDAVKYSKWVANDCCGTDLGTTRDARG